MCAKRLLTKKLDNTRRKGGQSIVVVCYNVHKGVNLKGYRGIPWKLMVVSLINFHLIQTKIQILSWEKELSNITQHYIPFKLI